MDVARTTRLPLQGGARRKEKERSVREQPHQPANSRRTGSLPVEDETGTGTPVASQVRLIMVASSASCTSVFGLLRMDALSSRGSSAVGMASLATRKGAKAPGLYVEGKRFHAVDCGALGWMGFVLPLVYKGEGVIDGARKRWHLFNGELPVSPDPQSTLPVGVRLPRMAEVSSAAGKLFCCSQSMRRSPLAVLGGGGGSCICGGGTTRTTFG
eukprot:scaffold2739_cov257-Pinguiococcus_pyrenoidosus.AAC.16